MVMGCGDPGPSQPKVDGDPPPEPVLTHLELTLPDVVEEPLGSRVMATVAAFDQDGRRMETPAETRLEVLDSDPYFAGSTVARPDGRSVEFALRLVWPGSVAVRAAAGSVRSTAVTMEVSPAEAVVGELVERRVVAGGEASLTGYRMDLLDASALRAGGAALEVLSRDASTLTFRVPDLSVPTEGCDPASWVAVDLPDVAVYGPAPTLRYGLGRVVELLPGEWAMLGAAPSGCLSFVDGEAAEYTLTFVDVRPIREAETAPEGSTQDWLFGRPFTIDVADRSVSAGGAAEPTGRAVKALEPEELSTLEDDVVRPSAPPDGAPPPDDYLPFMDRPLVLGERVSVDSEPFGTYEAARVLGLYGTSDEVVLLGLESEGARAALAGTSFNMDDALNDLVRGLPVLARAFSEEFPDNYMTRQVIVLVRANRGGAPGVAIASGGGSVFSRPSGYVLLQGYESVDWEAGGPDDGVYGLMHEAAHLAQVARDHDLCQGDPENACPWGTAGTWSVEGGADFTAHEAIRRLRGYGFAANEPGPLVLGSWHGAGYDVFETPTYSFGRGYGYAEWFMRHLMQSVVRAGSSVDDALATVARATYEPWYGWVSNKYFDPEDREVKEGPPTRPVPGLVSRMREALGPDWDPVEAMLLGAAIQAVDDRNPNPLLQDVTLGHADELYWGPFASFRLGSGAAVSVLTVPWTWGWADLEVPAGGGDFAYDVSVEGLEWIVVRRR